MAAKKVPFDLKPCGHCGETIPPVAPGGQRLCAGHYRRKQFCSVACRSAARVKPHCKRGHEMTEENIYIGNDGGRRCRTCLQTAWVRKNGERKRRRVSAQPVEVSWHNAKAADGPKVAAWCDRHMPWINSHSDDAGAHRIRDWRGGGRVDVFTLDRLLTRHNLHLSDLPDDVWIAGPARGVAA